MIVFLRTVGRIGTVYMRYNRVGLTQIGGMKLVYNRRGDIVSTYGTVKNTRNQGFVYTYNNNYSTNDAYAANDDADDNYYYYRHDGTKARIADDDDKK